MSPRRRWLLGAAALAAAPVLAAGGPAPRFLKAFGARLRYFELGRAGTRPTLVLLHGLGSSAQGDWGRVMPALARTHHVLAPDLLGFGGSDKPVNDYGIQTWGDFLGEFLRLKGVGAFTLMGESLGGWIATLVVWGRHDQLLPLALGERYAREIPGARLVVVEDSGHAPMIEGPEAFLAAVKDFLGR